MKKTILAAVLAWTFILYGCQSKPVCPSAKAEHLPLRDLQSLTAPADSSSAAPVEMKINGLKVTVDKVVDGPLCNDSWQGTVYVGCNVQVQEWEETPLFLQGCNLSIADGTTVYVAYHNNAAYYEGCSCHAGQ